MVLFKRKPITAGDPPPFVGEDTEVWVMRGSNEVFTDYSKYLERYDFYSQRAFTDAVNGKTGMTYFEALESENASSSDIDRIFPESLRAPILRKVQFSEISRIDDLVTYVYDEFRNDYFPGEEVNLVLDDGEQLEGVVREKANFPELRNADGTVQRPGFSRYFVKIKESQEEALLDGAHIKRGRNIFTKANIRSYLKNCLYREPWIGAPWLVREGLAHHYRLPMTIPRHLTKEGQAEKLRLEALAAQQDSTSAKNKKPKIAGPPPFSMDALVRVDDTAVNGEKSRHENHRTAPDDLDISRVDDGSKRPALNFLAPIKGTPAPDSGLLMKSVGPLLETWNALSVHWDVFELDPFTFDDFLDAMKFSSPNVVCELFDEIHCAVLKLLVNQDGEVQARLPEVEAESDEDGDTSMADDSIPATPVEHPPRIGRSRLSQVQNIGDTTNNRSKDKATNDHRANEMMQGRDWVERLAARDLSDGGWQVIMVDLLSQMSLTSLYGPRFQSTLSHLAPLDQPATQRTARSQYSTLDINDRVSALALIVQFAMSTNTIKNALEHRSEEMTTIRKQKTEMQRERKVHVADVNTLELERRANNPDAFLDDGEDVKSEVDTPVLANGNGHIDDTLSMNGNAYDEEDEDLRPAQKRAMNSRKRKRDEEVLRRENERLKELEKQKDKADKVKKYKRILRDLEAAKKRVADCEAQIYGFDDRLREMNNARMRALGRDRFWNRWWWFERVGMPFDGSRKAKSSRRGADTSANESAGYANGRLWVQGPVDMEREGFIELNESDAKLYAARHGKTVVERKLDEEGEFGVRTAEQWGYIDNAKDLDDLIGWLNDQGRREKDLKKELLMWRDDIATQFGQLSNVLNPEHAKDEEDEEEEEKPLAPRTRVSTRNKLYLDTDDVQKHWRCLRWHNTRASGKTGRHCNHKAEVTTTRDGTEKPGRRRRGGRLVPKVATAPKAEEGEEEEEVPPPPPPPTTTTRKASGRSGNKGGGKGVGMRVANGRAKEAIRANAKEERMADEVKVSHGRPVRSTRGSRLERFREEGFEVDDEDEEEDEDDHEDDEDDEDDGENAAQRAGVRTRRSTRTR